MKSFVSALALGLALAGAAAAQPSGGPDAKGNAPLKPGHTVNNGAAKPGRNSFTEGQARTHIEKAGFSGVSNLVKGDDGVWRGQAMRAGQTLDVAMDFKGNVSTPPAGAGASMAPAPGARSATSTTTTHTTDMAASSGATATHHRRRHAHRCANPSPNGAACSGVDRNANGVSDREDHAISNGAHP